jgi:hypothetical protein
MVVLEHLVDRMAVDRVVATMQSGSDSVRISASERLFSVCRMPKTASFILVFLNSGFEFGDLRANRFNSARSFGELPLPSLAVFRRFLGFLLGQLELAFRLAGFDLGCLGFHF